MVESLLLLLVRHKHIVVTAYNTTPSLHTWTRGSTTYRHRLLWRAQVALKSTAMPYVPPSSRSQGHLCTATTTAAGVVPHAAGGGRGAPPGRGGRGGGAGAGPPPAI